MFEFDAQLIQVELGSKAMEVFTPKDTRSLLGKLAGQMPPGWADDLIRATNNLKDKLKTDGIELPTVLFIPSPELSPNIFRISLGVAGENFDVFKDNYLNKLEEKIRAYHIPGLTKKKVNRLLNEALGLVMQKNFQEAMELLMHVYYLSSLVEHQAARIVSLLNMGGICLLNNKLDEACLVVKQAQLLADKENFYDPYLKFYTHKMIANLAALYNDYKASSELFEQAFADIEPSGESGYMIDALYNKSTVLMQMGAYKECTGVLDRIVSYIKYSNDYNKDILLKLYEMRAFIADTTIEELNSKLDELQKNYDCLSRNFLLKSQDALLTVVSKCGSYLITTFMGALMSGDEINNNEYNINQYNNSGNNIIGPGVK